MAFKNEIQLREALKYLRDNPHAKLSRVARDFGLPRGQLRCRFQGSNAVPHNNNNPNSKLSKAEEKALCNYIDRLDRINLGVNHEILRDAANVILRAKANPKATEIPTVSEVWANRFYKRYGYTRQRQKKMDAAREASESIPVINEYFRKLKEVIDLHGIDPADIWNMDETGFRLSMANDTFIITKRRRSHYFGLPENRESATTIEAISGGGEYTPLFVILSGSQHFAPWYQQRELDPRTAIAVSPTGYSNDELSLAWIKHFDKHTLKSARSSKRLLILDGHGSHYTREFIQYCEEHNIIPFGLPPHLIYILQPLDVVVFQPLKHYYTKAVETLIRDGLTNIGKLEFLGCINDCRRKAFKTTTIASTFKKTGIWPWDPSEVLTNLAARAARVVTPPPQPTISLLSSSPVAHTPLTIRHQNKAAEHIIDKLNELEDVVEELKEKVGFFIKGALTNTTELI